MSLGVEMELQIIDRKTKDLIAGAPKIFEKLGGEREHIKPELMQAMIEINTGVCENVQQVRTDLDEQVGILRTVCGELGYTLASSGSHPFARYADRIPYPDERYAYLIDRNRWIARRLMIFGLHVHVGMRDVDHMWQLNNAMMHYLPHVLALSASSPFWQGKDTGLASCRVTIFDALPTGGHPCTFAAWEEFLSTHGSMKSIETGRSFPRRCIGFCVRTSGKPRAMASMQKSFSTRKAEPASCGPKSNVSSHSLPRMRRRWDARWSSTRFAK